ncbi:MAG: dTDP-4-dehydrorhamnose reductase [Deltaproteobacteria bacterium RBG_16_49_23]|nr:MAG: dTDP-4-dehydrorhamnose reductase [Deltaproteobacteria bacterium RBG_16_49_23]
MSRILVIGAKGMLGRDLMKELQISFPGDEVLGWDIDEIDIRQKQDTVARIEGARPAIVINLAAYTDVDGCESNEQEAFAVNADGMRHVAMGVKRCGARVVYLSTDYVFDGKKGEPYREDDPPHPLSVYGRSKWKGEQYALELAGDGLIIRTQWLYGRYGKNFVTAILRQAKEKKILSIVNDQIGSPTYTVDLSRAISQLVRKIAGGIFHVTNSESCSWYDFGQAILKLSGIEEVQVLPISSSQLGRKAPRPPYSVLNTERFRKETGGPLRPWSEALKDFLYELEEGERMK